MTVRDPRRPAAPADVVGDDSPRSTRRPLLAAALALLLLAGASGAAELRERRAAEARERQLQDVVDLELTARFTGEVLRRSSGDRAEVERAVGVRNTGPRPLRLTAATLGMLRLSDEVVLAPGQEDRLLLVQQVDCRREPALLPEASVLQLEVRTAGGARRSVELPLTPEDPGPQPDQARRACGYLEVYEAARLELEPLSLDGDRLTVRAVAVNAGRSVVTLEQLRPGDGLALDVLGADGAPLALPVEVAAAGPSGEPFQLPLVLSLRVSSCDRVQAGDLMSFEPGSAGALTSVFSTEQDRTLEGGGTSLLPDLPSLTELLEASC